MALTSNISLLAKKLNTSQRYGLLTPFLCCSISSVNSSERVAASMFIAFIDSYPSRIPGILCLFHFRIFAMTSSGMAKVTTPIYIGAASPSLKLMTSSPCSLR